MTVDVEESANSIAMRRLDASSARVTLSRIAPHYEWQGEKWNVSALFAEALRLNPELAHARAAYLAASADVEASHVASGFAVSLSAEYAFNPPESSNWLYGIAGDLPVDRGGRRHGRITSAELLAQAAALDFASSAWSVRQRIRRAIDAHVTWEQETGISDALVSARQRQFETLQRRVEAGEIARGQLEQARASLADALRIRASARSMLARTRLEIAAAVGVAPDAIDEAGLAHFDIDAIAALPPIDNDAVDAALEGRPEILRAMLAYDQSESDLRVAVATQYPEIRVAPGYTWERGLSKLPFGLSLSFPNRDFSKAAIAAAEARRAEAGKNLEAAVNGVVAGIAAATADYHAALQVLEVVRVEILPAADALADQADLELEAGATDRAEWASAQAGRHVARLDEIAAIRSVLEAEAGLEDALRRPLRGIDMVPGVTLLSPEQDVDQ